MRPADTVGHHCGVESEDGATLSEELQSRTWWIGLSGWVLQDGNYTDFVTGERRQFALEFGYARAARLQLSSSRSAPRCHFSGRSVTYEVVGLLLRGASEPMRDAFVLDFGLRAYAPWLVLDDLQPPAAGDWLTGEISLSVDHFAYMDELAHRPQMPPLIYTWRIDEIQLSTTPSVQVGFGHALYVGPDEGPMLVPDPSRESWRTIPQTRMWDDDGNYRLRCTLESPAPTSSMALTGTRSPYGPLRASARATRSSSARG